jgi:hypothetical protein
MIPRQRRRRRVEFPVGVEVAIHRLLEFAFFRILLGEEKPEAEQKEQAESQGNKRFFHPSLLLENRRSAAASTRDTRRPAEYSGTIMLTQTRISREAIIDITTG